MEMPCLLWHQSELCSVNWRWTRHIGIQFVDRDIFKVKTPNTENDCYVHISLQRYDWIRRKLRTLGDVVEKDERLDVAGEAGVAEEGNQVDGEDVAGEEDVVEKADEEGVAGVAEKVDEADGEDVAEKDEKAGVAGVVDVAGVAGVADVVDVDEAE